MAAFPPITVRHPQPHDIVDDPISICGVGTGFEGTFAARVRNRNGVELVMVTVHAGGTAVWGNFHVELDLVGVPGNARGTLEIFEFSASDGSEINKVVVPIVFGRALIDPYHGFAQHTVVAVNTLSNLAQDFYGDAAQWRRIYRANRDQLHDPNLIFVGQTLRIPQ